MKNDWYYMVMSQVNGPLTSKELRQAAIEGKISAGTWVRKGKQGDWHRAERVKGLLSPSHGRDAKGTHDGLSDHGIFGFSNGVQGNDGKGTHDDSTAATSAEVANNRSPAPAPPHRQLLLARPAERSSQQPKSSFPQPHHLHTPNLAGALPEVSPIPTSFPERLPVLPQTAYETAAKLMVEGHSTERIQETLIGMGLDRDSSIVIVKNLNVERARIYKDASQHNMFYGCLWILGGLGFTALTHEMAKSSGGGTYFVVGALSFGGAFNS